MSDPFFIVGCVRSGTTLLRNLLRRHPNLECPEETNFFRWAWPFGSKPYRGRCAGNVLKMHREMDGFSEDEYWSLYEQSHSRRDLAELYGNRFLEKKGSGARRWFDKTPQNVYGMLLIGALFPSAKFLHIHRNPLNAIASLVEGKLMPAEPIKVATNYWLESMCIIGQYKAAWPHRVIEVRYESLVVNLDKEMKRIFREIGERPVKIKLKPGEIHEERNRHAEILSRSDIDYVKKRCAQFLTAYGYDR